MRWKSGDIEIRIGPIGASINRVETYYISTAHEIICRINDAFKAFYRNNRKAMVAEHG